MSINYKDSKVAYLPKHQFCNTNSNSEIPVPDHNAFYIDTLFEEIRNLTDMEDIQQCLLAISISLSDDVMEIDFDLFDFILSFVMVFTKDVIKIIQFLVKNNNKYDEIILNKKENLFTIIENNINEAANDTILLIAFLAKRKPSDFIEMIDLIYNQKITKEILLYIISILDFIKSDYNFCYNHLYVIFNKCLISSDNKIQLLIYKIITITNDNKIIEFYKENYSYFGYQIFSKNIQTVAIGFRLLSEMYKYLSICNCIEDGKIVIPKAYKLLLSHQPNMLKKEIFNYITEYTIKTKAIIDENFFVLICENIYHTDFDTSKIGIMCLASIIIHTNSNLFFFQSINLFSQYLWNDSKVNSYILYAIKKIVVYAYYHNRLNEIFSSIADIIGDSSIDKMDETTYNLIHDISSFFDTKK